MTASSEKQSDNTENRDTDTVCPHIGGKVADCLVDCYKPYDKHCECFLPFGTGGFCKHPDAQKWIKQKAPK